jgi:pilus assembly protein Flp/PilA
MKKFTARFLRENNGVTAIEYGLIAGLIALVIATAITPIGTDLSTLFGKIATSITTATPS